MTKNLRPQNVTIEAVGEECGEMKKLMKDNP